MAVGIESINAYVGRASLGVRDLFAARGLDMARLGNLMMERKSVNLPNEDPVTNGVNAARPLVEALAPAERDAIELVVVGTESGLDFGKPISTYIHEYLGLSRRCRSFEVKHACYGGTAALQTAAAIVAGRPGARALVIATDAASVAARDTYWEPSQGAGAVAMIVGDRPDVLDLDPGANGFHSHEVMDTLRPRPDLEAGSSDLSVLSYMNCLEETWRDYSARVGGADLVDSFGHLVLHTPFAGMVRGAHRTLLRRHKRAAPADIDRDFDARVAVSLRFCQQVGNVYSAALYLALCSLLSSVSLGRPERIGLFSYGSGCASEFYSGVVDEYELVSDLSLHRMCGVRDHEYDVTPYEAVYRKQFEGRSLLVLDRVENFHRRYRWS